MPFRDGDIAGTMATAGIPDTAPPDVSAMDVLGAAFSIDNTVGSAMARGEPIGTTDPDFDIWQATQDRGLQDHFDHFTTVRNAADFERQAARLETELHNREILHGAGLGGFAASMAASVFDLPSLIPGAALVRTGRAVRAANAGRVAASTGVAAGIAEGALQSTQLERTGLESGIAVGGSVVLGAVLGSLFGKAGAAEARAASTQLENLPVELKRLNKDLSAAATPDEIAAAYKNLRVRNEGRFEFMRKFPGGYLGDIAEKFGAPGVKSVLDKFAPLAPFTRMTPTIRSQLQTGTVGRQVFADLAESPLQYELNDLGQVASKGGSVETIARTRIQTTLTNNLWSIRKAYGEYLKDGPMGTIGTLAAPYSGAARRLVDNGSKLTAWEFRREVGRAMFMADTHPIQGVQAVANRLRGDVFDRIKADMEEVGLFNEVGYKPKFGHSYMTRRYRLDEILKREPEVAARLEGEFKKTRVAAQRAVQQAEAAQRAVDEEDLLRSQMDDGDIKQAVLDTLRSIKGLRPGENMLQAVQANPMRARVLDVHDDVLLDMGILETDIGVLVESYVRSTIPQIEMQRKFGNLDLKDQIKQISDDYQQLRAEAPNATERRRLEVEERSRRFDLEGVHQRILGVYDLPRNPDDIWSRAGEVAKSLTYMQLLGMQVAAALPDVAGIASRGSIRELTKGLAQMATDMPSFARAIGEAAELLNASEFVMNTRTQALTEINSRYMSGSLLERGMEGGTAAFSNLTGITAWNAATKSIAHVITMSRMLKAADAWSRGKATKKQIRALTENNIDQAMARRMTEAFNKYGQKGKHLWFARAGDWRTGGEAVAKTPPAASDFVRLYHGGDLADEGATLPNTFTSSLDRAKSFSGENAEIRYIDVPKGHPIVEAAAINNYKTTVEPKLSTKELQEFGGPKKYNEVDRPGEDYSDAFEAGMKAMRRETDIAIITPGQDKPLFMSSRIGSVLFQLKSFGVAANERIVLSGIQRADADVATQFAILFGLGAVVSNLRADMSGRPRKEGADLVIDAVDRAGPFQIAFEANAVLEAGGVGASNLFGTQLPSRFQGRSFLLGAAGPSVDMAATALEVMAGAQTERGLTSRDVDKITRLIPGQNSPYAMIFRDDIRQGIGSSLGVDYE